MKILLDVNVVLDLFLKREPFFDDAYKIFVAIENKKVKGYLSASSVDTIYYLLSKELNKEKAKEVIKKLLILFDITEVNKKVINEALSYQFRDFEDAIISSSAYFKKIDFIISRNIKDFKNSKVKVLTPTECVIKILSKGF